MPKAPRNDLEAHATLVATAARERRLKATQKRYAPQSWTWIDTVGVVCLLASLAWSLWRNTP